MHFEMSRGRGSLYLIQKLGKICDDKSTDKSHDYFFFISVYFIVLKHGLNLP